MIDGRNRKAIFVDSDLACLFSDIRATHNICTNMALLVQVLDYIRLTSSDDEGWISVTVPSIRRDFLPFLGDDSLKRLLDRLRALGVIKTKVRYHKKIAGGGVSNTEILLQDENIGLLAEEIKRMRDMSPSSRDGL